jgi:CRP/FNR family transcriptional regulator, cyclic AMP receptor protein
MELAKLEKDAFVRHFKKGQTVFMPSDRDEHVFVVADGRICLTSATPDGKRIIFGFIEPGEMFGELALFEPNSREERAEAERDSTVVMIHGKSLLDVMEQSPTLTLGITKLISFRRTRIERRLRNLLFRSTRDRLIHLLLELSETYGQEKSGHIAIDLKLSHQDIASIIGATRESVTKSLGELQLDRLIRVARQRISIIDLRGLAALADLPTPSVCRQPTVKPMTEPFISTRPLTDVFSGENL